ncbi:MAG: hypothetical protein COA79_11180 [Planctomycetota bacterium]|nr:MAG: hypothetical protein COA79_11180 [Planctomycetota bacterium]
MKKISFSLIELMAVIVVILILITFAIPSMEKVRKKARTVICANQLKQLGVLLATYANDHDGYLPYSNRSDYQDKGFLSYRDSKKGKLYGQWAGHLIPYFDVDLPTWDRRGFYHDKARQGYSLLTFNEETGDMERNASVDADENYGNWKLLNTMYYEGGHGDLKMFICPEAPNTFYPQHVKTERYIPRVSGVLPTRYSSLNGLPSSYVANGQLFGLGTKQSRRLEDVNKTNYLLLEGVSNSSLCTPTDYRKFFELDSVYGGNVNNIIGGWSSTAQTPTMAPRSMMASFMHDDTTEIWLSHRNPQGSMPASYINRYNKSFNPIAAASYMWDAPEKKLAVLMANQYPGEDWENYELSFTKDKYKIYRYFGADWMPNHMFGNMNYLGSDLSVNNENLGKMFENGRTLGGDTQ